MSELWCKEREIEFFTEALKTASPDQLFYVTDDSRYLSYWPKGYKGEKSTLQSRNSFIGEYTEKWASGVIQEFAQRNGLYAVRGVICEEMGLSTMSPADVALCRLPHRHQTAGDILLVFEVKMSVVWNWELAHQDDKHRLVCIGDCTTHQGNPGLLRSDTMLKAIGKSLNIRIASPKASRIPIVILGNTPIASSYFAKVDHLRTSGIVQGFWSLNPLPFDTLAQTLKRTPSAGFCRIDSTTELETMLTDLLQGDREFFSSMRTKDELGRFVEIANNETELRKKAERFLNLIKG